MIKIEPPHGNVVLLRPGDLDINAVAGGTENPQLVRAHEQVVVCSTHGVFIDEAIEEVAANHPWIDRDRTLLQHIRADPLPQVGALGTVSSEDDRPTVKQRRGGVTRHVDDATKDAWHPYELEPHGDGLPGRLDVRGESLTAVPGLGWSNSSLGSRGAARPSARAAENVCHRHRQESSEHRSGDVYPKVVEVPPCQIGSKRACGIHRRATDWAGPQTCEGDVCPHTDRRQRTDVLSAGCGAQDRTYQPQRQESRDNKGLGAGEASTGQCGTKGSNGSE